MNPNDIEQQYHDLSAKLKRTTPEIPHIGEFWYTHLDDIYLIVGAVFIGKDPYWPFKCIAVHQHVLDSPRGIGVRKNQEIICRIDTDSAETRYDVLKCPVLPPRTLLEQLEAADPSEYMQILKAYTP